MLIKVANCNIHTFLKQTRVLSPTLDIPQISKLHLPHFQQTSEQTFEDAEETSGKNATGAWPYSLKNLQKPSDSGHDSLRQYIEQQQSYAISQEQANTSH
ncbi:hypothetical protein [Pseudomonas syringae]|uniref:hypothetical protein n=1 Tax=Pseudomonas syringae TaxID=317 RepID=UPI0034D414AE